MPPSKPHHNRKSFTLSLSLQLPRPSKDHDAPPRSPGGDNSSPRTPLLQPPSLHLKQEQPILPIPLTDGLDPSEKMKLLRKTRKLSRILGEVPIPVSIEDGAPIADLRYGGFLDEPPTSASTSTSASSSPSKTPAVFERSSPLARSATEGYDATAHGGMQQRTRSFASLHPPLTIPPAVVTTRPSPVDSSHSWPKKFPPVPASPHSPVSPSAGTLPPFTRDSISVFSRRDSTASSILVPETTPKQIQRTRAAKLARQLGGNIPPEILLRASSPTPYHNGSSSSTEPQARSPLKRTWSARRTARTRSNSNRLSLDLTTLVRTSHESKPDPSSFLLVSEMGKPRVLLKKSNSVAGRARPRTAESPQLSRLARVTAHSDMDSDLDDSEEDDLGIERQRAVNVWRARKMAQMFGNDPPPALFSSVLPRRSEEGKPASLVLEIPGWRKRDSRATLGSVDTNLLAASPIERARRSSGASSRENLSPLVFADPASISESPQTPHPDGPSGTEGVPSTYPYLTSTLESLVDARQTPPIAVRLTSTLTSSPSQQSLSAAFTTSLAQSQTPSHRSHTPLLAAPTGSPPPFANMFHWDASSSSCTPSTASAPLPNPASAPAPASAGPPESLFRLRRMRAAKLSRFFGVGMQDITGVLVASPSSSPAPFPSLTPTAASAPLPIPAVPPLPPPISTKETTTVPAPASPPCMRGFAASGVEESPSLRRSARNNNHSATRPAPRPQISTSTLASASSASSTDTHTLGGDHTRWTSEPENLPPPQLHNRSYSTTVEIASESKGMYSFLEGRRGTRVKELEMHAAIKQLRKIK